MVNPIDETEQCLLGFGEVGGFEILKDIPDEGLVSEELSRDRGVRIQSKRTVISLRRVGGDQLPKTRGQGRIFPENLLCESGEMLRCLRTESEQMPDLRILLSPALHGGDRVCPRRGRRIGLHFRQEHGFHGGTDYATGKWGLNNGL